MDFGFLGGLGFYTRDSSAGAPFRLSGTFPRRPERMKEWAAAEALDSPARAGLSGGAASVPECLEARDGLLEPQAVPLTWGGGCLPNIAVVQHAAALGAEQPRDRRQDPCARRSSSTVFPGNFSKS